MPAALRNGSGNDNVVPTRVERNCRRLGVADAGAARADLAFDTCFGIAIAAVHAELPST
jgi:hypothetical protein